MSLPFVIHSSFDIAGELSTELRWACSAVFWRCSHCQLHSVGKCVVCFFFFFKQLLQPGAWGCWSRRFHFTPVRWPLFFQAPKRFRLGGGGARVLAGLPWIPPPLARALPGSTNFVGTNAQAHLLVMSLKVAKCNLGKVNLEAMLVSSFPSYTRGGPMPLAGAPRDFYTQLLACSSSQSVVSIACCLRAILCFGFLPSLPPS